jgi:glycosyltransferase involved in cell wall biosynthesis
MNDLKLGINLVDFDPTYKGGINTFATGLIEKLKIKNKILILATEQNYNYIKKNIVKKNFFFLKIKKKSFAIKLLRLLSIILKSQLMYKISVYLEYSKVTKKIDRNCNLFYCPLTNLRPLNLKIKTITSIHDIQHLNLPENFSLFEKNYRELLHSTTVSNSSIIQASSFFIKKNLIKFYSEKIKSKIIVIREGVSEKFKRKNKIELGNYIFFPAQLWPHKNHLVVLEAIKIINQRNNIKIKLIMSGENYKNSKKILEFINLNKQLDVKYLGKVNFDHLKELYINCRFVISPSIYESSSLVILESIKINKPVIASNTAPNIELSKFFKINYFETKNATSLAILILKIWNKEKLIKAQIKFNKKKIHLFSWDYIAKEYSKEFTKIIEN